MKLDRDVSVEAVQVNYLEKELEKGAKLRTCYYASQLQYSTKSQQQQVRDKEDVMDFEEEGHPSEWFLDGEKRMSDLSLRHCNSDELESLEDHCEVNEVDEEEEEGEMVLAKFGELERLPSGLFQAMQPTSMSPNLSMQPSENNLYSGPKNDTSQMNIRGLSMYPCKRELSCEDDMQHQCSTNQNKRMRKDGQWDHRGSTIDMCLEQMSSVQCNIRSLYSEKKALVMDAERNQPALMSEVQCLYRSIENLEIEVHQRDGYL